MLFAGATPFSITISQAGLGVAYVCAAALMVRRRRVAGAGARLHLPFLGYVVSDLVSAVLSVNRANAFVLTKRLLLIPVAYAVAEYVEAPRDLGRLAAPFLFTTAVLSVGGLARYSAGPGGIEERVRFTHYMTTAGLLMVALCMGTGLLLAGASRRWRVPLVMSLAANAACLLFTFTRSAWLGLAAGLALMLGSWRRMALVPYAAVLAGAVTLMPSALRERLASTFHPGHVNNIERVHMWAAALRIWRDHALFGVGDISTGPIYRQYMSPGAGELAGHFHSNPVHLLVTLGAVGLAAVAWLMWRIARYEREAWRAVRPGGGLPAAVALAAWGILAAFHVAGLFEWNMGDAEMAAFLWYSVGLSIAARRVSVTSA